MRQQTKKLDRLWEIGFVALDANVLLNLYRYPGTSVDQFFRILKALDDRVWIPHQVASEFTRNRRDVILAGRRGIQAAYRYR